MKKILFLFLMIFLLDTIPVYADVSFETGVSVEKEAEDASLAKDEAMKEAYRQALLKVSERLTTKENVDKINLLTDEQLVNFIKETDVIAEKNTKNGYAADLNIKINGELLKQYMIENEMMSVVTSRSEVLVIPLFSDTEYSGTVLFEDGNVWRSTLLQKGEIKAGNVQIDIIEDNPSVQNLLTADIALHMTDDIYEKLRFITQARHIYTVHAVKAGQNTMVLVIKNDKGNQKRILVTAENEDLFEKAVREMASYISVAEEEKDVVQSAYQSKISVVFEYKGLKQWLSLQQKLNQISIIKKIETGAMENNRVLFEAEFSGTIENLTDVLTENALDFVFENGTYKIYMRE